MNLTCERCSKPFDAVAFRGYCDNCQAFFRSVRDQVHRAQRPAPGVLADGKFRPEDECPHTVYDPVRQANVCGLCGSDQIEMGYGLGTGHGMGSYNYCMECYSFLDFSEDGGE